MLNFYLKKIIGWFGIVSIVSLSIFPIFSQAINSDQKSLEVICSATGIKFVNVSDSKQPHTKNIVHCSYCSMIYEDYFENFSKPNIKKDVYFDSFLNYYSSASFFIFYFHKSNLNSPPIT